jgi:hypothetical protein
MEESSDSYDSSADDSDSLRTSETEEGIAEENKSQEQHGIVCMHLYHKPVRIISKLHHANSTFINSQKESSSLCTDCTLVLQTLF